MTGYARRWMARLNTDYPSSYAIVVQPAPMNPYVANLGVELDIFPL